MSAKIRAQYPHFYRFGEYFDSSIGTLSNFERATDIAVLDFAGKDAMQSVFSNPNSSFATLNGYLDTDFSTYRNPYELATFVSFRQACLTTRNLRLNRIPSRR